MGNYQEQIENRFRLAMIDRMLKEKYNEIEYLAIQTSDPNIQEINKADLEWLLNEQKKVTMLEQNIEKCKMELEAVQQKYCQELNEKEYQYNELEKQYLTIINSRSWKTMSKITRIIDFFLTPFSG